MYLKNYNCFLQIHHGSKKLHHRRGGIKRRGEQLLKELIFRPLKMFGEISKIVWLCCSSDSFLFLIPTFNSVNILFEKPPNIVILGYQMYEVIPVVQMQGFLNKTIKTIRKTTQYRKTI